MFLKPVYKKRVESRCRSFEVRPERAHLRSRITSLFCVKHPSLGTGSSSQAGLPRGERLSRSKLPGRSAMYPDTNAVVSHHTTYYCEFAFRIFLRFLIMYLFEKNSGSAFTV